MDQVSHFEWPFAKLRLARRMHEEGAEPVLLNEIFRVLAEEDAVEDLRFGLKNAVAWEFWGGARQGHLLRADAHADALAGADRRGGARQARARGEARIESDPDDAGADLADRAVEEIGAADEIGDIAVRRLVIELARRARLHDAA